MSRYAPIVADTTQASAGARLARLQGVAELVAEMAPGGHYRRTAFEIEAIDRAYEEAPTLLQARFDDAAAQSARFAAAGVEALLDGRATSLAAVEVLASGIADAVHGLHAMIAGYAPRAFGVEGSAPHSAQLPS